MARIARVVVPGCWHHITQRGNRQQTVFLDDADRAMHFQFLAQHAARNALRVAGYCLMGNHGHLIATPPNETGLAKTLGRTHVDYERFGIPVPPLPRRRFPDGSFGPEAGRFFSR